MIDGAVNYIYDGEWADDCKHGDGKESDASGHTFKGRFEHGKRVGAGRLFTAMSKLDGEWKQNRPTGSATLTLKEHGSETIVQCSYDDAGTQYAPMRPSLPHAAPILFM